MFVMREVIARVLVATVLVAGSIAIGTWWASLLVTRTAGSLSAIAAQSLDHEISARLAKLAPGEARLPGVEAAIRRAVRDPAVTQAFAQSGAKGSSALSAELTRLDAGLSGVVTPRSFVINAGRHELAKLANRLRAVARAALILACMLAAIALAVSPLRRLVLRHISFGFGVIGGSALVLSWALPALVGHFTHGGIHRFATRVLSGGDPVRALVLECFIGGFAVYVATHLFELIGGGFPTDVPDAPLPEGKVV